MRTTPDKELVDLWRTYLSDEDWEVFLKSGYGKTGGMGSRPALLIIDVNYNFTGEGRDNIVDQVKTWRNACGESAWDAVSVTKGLISACREKRLPIFYTTNTRRPDGWDATSRTWKNFRALEDYEREKRGNEIVAEIEPSPSDIVIVKPKPSGFFGTPLLSYLVYLKVDTLLVCGVSTSGCVRATVTDAFSNNFHVALVSDACFDRTQASHAVNLFDMNAKYADVMSSAAVRNYISQLPDGLFDLPRGDLVTHPQRLD